jgi:hypothetical protein
MNSFLKRLLNEPKLFIDLIPKDLSEEANVGIFLREALDPTNDGSCPLYDELLQTITLVQVSVHVLLHGFSGLFGFVAFLIMALFGAVDVENEISELLKGQLSRVVRGGLHMDNRVRLDGRGCHCLEVGLDECCLLLWLKFLVIEERA